MITAGAALVSIALIAADPADVREIFDRVAALLNNKGSEIPYGLTYESIRTQDAQADGGKHVLRLYSDGKVLYLTDKDDQSRSRILFQNEVVLWEYWDEGAGTVYFRGNLSVEGDNNAESVLLKHVVPLCAFAEENAAVVQWSRTVLKSDVRHLSIKSSETGTECVAERMRLRLTVGNSGLEVAQLPRDGKKAEPATFLRYNYVAGMQKSIVQEIQAFREEVEKAEAQGKVRTIAPQFSVTRAFEILAEARRVQPIEVGKLSDIAASRGYLIPTDKSLRTISARGVVNDFPSRELEIVVKSGESEYAIVEYIPPMRREGLPPAFLKEERKLDGYSILRIVDPGTGGKFVYYMGASATFIVKDAKFRDDVLDRIILGCKQPVVGK